MRYLFVYGTMMMGQRNHHRLADVDVRFIGKASVYGWLYQFPFFDFPVFRPDWKTIHRVEGELYEVGDYELYVIDREEKWYKRKVYRIFSENGPSPIFADLYEGFKYLPYVLAKKLLAGRWR